jgi:hypothetical protein
MISNEVRGSNRRGAAAVVSVSVILLFDGPASELFDGSWCAGCGPTALKRSIVLTSSVRMPRRTLFCGSSRHRFRRAVEQAGSGSGYPVVTMTAISRSLAHFD